MNQQIKSGQGRVLSVIIIPILMVMFGMAVFMIQTGSADAAILSKSEPDGGTYGVIYTRTAAGKTKVLERLNSNSEVDLAMSTYSSYKAGKSTFVIKLNKNWTSQHFFTNEMNNSVEINLNGHKWTVTGKDCLEISTEADLLDVTLSKIKDIIPRTVTVKNGEMSFTGGADGVFQSENGILKFKDVTFSDCNTKGDGLIWYERKDKVGVSWYFFDKVQFINCINSGDGGAIYFKANNISYSDRLLERNYFNECRFINCKATDGGAICFAEENNDVYFRKCEFFGCKATDKGGAVYFNGGESSFTFDDCFINGCTSYNQGGAFYLDGSEITVTLDKTDISNCESTSDDAGAVWFDGNYGHLAGTVDSKGEKTSSITNCSADDDGGAITSSGSSGCGNYCTVSNIRFADNTAGADGGAICFCGNENIAKNCSFFENYADDEGGAIYTDCDSKINNCYFSYDRADDEDTQEIYTDNGYLIINNRFYNNVAQENICNSQVIWAFLVDKNLYNEYPETKDTFLAQDSDGALYEKELDEVNKVSIDPENTVWGSEGKETWYLVDTATEIDHDVTIAGNVNVIIKDKCSITVNGSVIVPNDAKISIYGEKRSPDAGLLIVKGKTKGKAAVRGKSVKKSGTFSLCSGNLEVYADKSSRVIGSSLKFNAKKANYSIKAGTKKSKAKSVKVGYKLKKYAAFNIKEQ